MLSVLPTRDNCIDATASVHVHLHKKLSYRRGTARRAMSAEILSTATQLCKIIAFENVCNRRMTLNVTQGHRKWRDSIRQIPVPVSDF